MQTLFENCMNNMRGSSPTSPYSPTIIPPISKHELYSVNGGPNASKFKHVSLTLAFTSM